MTANADAMRLACVAIGLDRVRAAAPPSPHTTRIDETTFTLPDGGGFDIFARRWAAAEHSLRYERLARLLATAGYAVYANDHRGHGRTAASLDRAGIAGADGWNGMVHGLKRRHSRWSRGWNSVDA